jgi:negative regulator of flagellin synthesis FlgM
MTNLTPINSGATGRIVPVDARPDAVDNRKPARARRGDDRVEVSDQARFLAKLNAMPEVRTELVERVRGEIANGTYDTDEKFDLAVDAMIDENI